MLALAPLPNRNEAKMGDPRLGQFGDPGFGASLSTSQPAQGVLPAPAQDTSASSDGTNNGVNTFGAPGLMGQGNSNPGSVYLAEGGVVPDGAQDSGDAAPAQSDPFSLITAALQTGRKKYGLPANFFGGGQGQGQAQAQPQQDQAQPDDGDGDDDTQHFAEGGAVEGDDDQDQQGVIPTEEDQSQDPGQGQDRQQQGGANPQGAMAYLSGQGGVSPEVAKALEMRVDPQGKMDPSLRKMLAISQAGDPDKAFQVMQHYRQKFNALGAFAKAALTGSGGRPPNPAAAADALNQAYDHVPDGKAMHFRPTEGGMQVTVHDVAPKGQQQQQPQQDDDDGAQHFAEGGVVPDDINYETAGSETPSGSSYDRSQQADAAQAEPDDSGEDWETRKKNRSARIKGFGDKVGGAIGNALSPTEGEAEGYRQIGGAIASGAKAINDSQDYSSITKPANAVKNFVLSIPALLGWQSKDGQFDSVMDKGVDPTLEAASKAGMAPGAQGTFAQPQGQGQQQQQPGQDAMAQATPPQQGQQAPAQQPQDMQMAHKPTPTEPPQQVGAQIGANAKEQGLTINDALHQVDIAYGNWAGQQKAKALAKAAIIKEFAVEQVKGQNSLERARITGQYGVERATTTGAAGIEKGLNHEAAATGRTHETNETKSTNADKKINADADRTEFVQGQLTARADTNAKPSLVGNKDKIEAAAAARTPAHIKRPQQAGQQQAQQLPPEAVKNLKEGQNTKFKNGQVWTLRGGQPVQVQ